MIKLPRGSAGEREAVESMNEILGFDLTEVVSPNDWSAALIDGEPQVLANVNAVRAIALFAPNQERASQFVRWMEALQQEAQR